MLIEITAKEGRKIIERHDVELPKQAKYIAQDEDGQFHWMDGKPKLSKIDNWWNRLYINSGLLDAGYCWKPNPDWRDTMIDVSKIR